MYKLYHHFFCPFSKKVRMHLAAKEINFDLALENIIERRKEFISLNPAATLPVLYDNEKSLAICNSFNIIEYIEEKHQDQKNFIGSSLEIRAEVRRLQNWFDDKFYNEIVRHILAERYINRFAASAKAPSAEVLRVARHNLNTHFNYIEYLLESRKYLAAETVTVADFAAAGQISVMDYFGDINWQHYPAVKEWFSLLKSHKFYSEILKDRVANIKPSDWYSKIDF